MVTLTPTQKRELRTYGYTTVEDVVPAETCEAVIEGINDYLEIDAAGRATTYDPPEYIDERSFAYGGVDCFHSQGAWDARQHHDVYELFADLLGTEGLWATVDGADYKPPRNSEAGPQETIPLHWQLEPSEIRADRRQPEGTDAFPYGVNGLLLLHDTTLDHGVFTCVPEVYQDLGGFFDERPDVSRIGVEVGSRETVPLAGSRGSMILWDRRVPYGNGHNRTDTPRYAQFLRLVPERFGHTDERTERISNWQATTPQPNLTPLGRKLLGIDPWHGWLTQ